MHISQTIAPPPEEVAVTPSTPTATTKFFIQSSDGAKQLEDGTKPKEALNSVKPAKSMSASKQDVQKKSGGSSGRTEPSTRPEVKGTSTETKKKEVGMEKQAMGLLDLLTDTTSEHEKHVYHPQCQICLGKEPPPSQSDNTESERYPHTFTCLNRVGVHVHFLSTIIIICALSIQ